jgi:CheY-like chemotaxis protein
VCNLKALPPPERGLRVLIVEDVADASAVLALLLRMEGHDVRVAPDGPAALALAEAISPDVVLLDIRLPGLDGWEVARRLRRRSGKPPFLVALTGYGGECDRRRSEAAGIDLHLVKPADPELLLWLLRRFQRTVRGTMRPAQGATARSASAAMAQRTPPPVPGWGG